jgi:hypothetical protein
MGDDEDEDNQEYEVINDNREGVFKRNLIKDYLFTL